MNTRTNEMNAYAQFCPNSECIASGQTGQSNITAASPKAFEQGVHSLKRGGTAVLVGLPPDDFPVNIFGMVFNGLTIRGSIVGTRADLIEALQFAANGKVHAVFDTARLDQINDIFSRMEKGTIEGRTVLVM